MKRRGCWGAVGWIVFCGFILPLMRMSLAACATLVFIEIMKELLLTLI